MRKIKIIKKMKKMKIKLGTLVEDEEKGTFHISGVSDNLTWCMHSFIEKVLAYYIRLFVAKSKIIGNYIYYKEAPDEDLSVAQENLDSDEMKQKWDAVLLDLANRLESLSAWDDNVCLDTQTFEEAYRNHLTLKKETFDLLEQVWDDLWW